MAVGQALKKAGGGAPGIWPFQKRQEEYNNLMSAELKSFSQTLCGFVILLALLVVFVPDAKAVAKLLPGPPVAKELSIVTAGAVGDGLTLNTAAIQRAIDTLATNRGGTLVIPKGEFLSGAIYLKPGVNLRLDKGAVLKGSTNIEDYPEVETRIEGHFQVWVPALVNASNVDHLRIMGPGTIAGGGKPFWDEFGIQRRANTNVTNVAVKRPRDVFIQDSKDVQISGISLRESGFWNLHLFRCTAVLVKGVDIRGPFKAPSTDGIDVDSCRNVTIKNSYISVVDDNICLKGNKGTSALDDTNIPPVGHVRISGCEFGMGNSALTLGSEATVVRDVVMEDCRLTGTNKNFVLKLKLRPDTEQHYENVMVRNIKVQNPNAELVSIAGWGQFLDLEGKPAPSQWVTNVTLANITGTLHDFGKVDGTKKSTVANITFKNINIALTNPDVAVKKVKNLKFTQVKINGQAYTGEQPMAGK
jgi:alpha-L-rhamnosidase